MTTRPAQDHDGECGDEGCGFENSRVGGDELVEEAGGFVLMKPRENLNAGN